MKCWGGNERGQLGLGDTTWRGDNNGEMGYNLPAVDLGVGGTALAIAAGYVHTCALLSGGNQMCWGDNDLGQLGLGDTTWRGDNPDEMGYNLAPVYLGAGKSAAGITANGQHTCALLSDGSVKCWGYNDFGQLGLGDTIRHGDNVDEMGDNLPSVKLFSNVW
jgi:alpha-tubulin suppressor-like RCC1 family protein